MKPAGLPFSAEHLMKSFNIMIIQMTPEVTSKDRFQVAHLPDFHVSRESDPHPCLA